MNPKYHPLNSVFEKGNTLQCLVNLEFDGDKFVIKNQYLVQRSLAKSPSKPKAVPPKKQEEKKNLDLINSFKQVKQEETFEM